MCFHTRREFDEYVAARAKRKQRESIAGKHAKSEEKFALIVLRDAKGNFVAGYHCDPRDPQDVANTILDLKTWHAGEFKYVDTADVDAERKRLKLKMLDADGLPLPDRVARAGTDDEIENEFRMRDLAASLAIVTAFKKKYPGHLETMTAGRRRREASLGLDLNEREVEQRDKARAEAEAEIARLAEEHGMTVEKVRETLKQRSA